MKKLLVSTLIFLAAVAGADPLKVRIWSGFPPGGGTDVMCRELQKRIVEQDPSAEVVVEYATGASGVVALRKLASLEKTQYVELLVDGSNQLLTTYLSKTNDVDLDNSIKVVAPIGYTQMIVMSSRASGIADLKSLKRAAQSKSLNYGSAGLGSVTFSTTAFLGYKLDASQQMVNVPYKGTAPFYVDLIAGRIDLASDYVVAGAAQVKSNKVVGVAVTGDKRSELVPSVPTLKEQGIADFPLNPWFGVFTNNTSDTESVSRIRKMLAKSFGSQQVVNRYAELGVTVSSPEQVAHAENWYKVEKQTYKKVSAKLEPAIVSKQK